MVKKDDRRDDIQIIAPDILPVGKITLIEPIPEIEVLDTFHHITELDLEDPEKVIDLVELMNESIMKVLVDDVLREDEVIHLMDLGGAEFGPKFVITAELNQYAANKFCSRIRHNLSDITVSHDQVTQNQELDWSTIWQLSSKWNLPLMLVKTGMDQQKGHYTLALKEPEQTPKGEWRVLIYDPMSRGERWHSLPSNWRATLGAGSSILRNDLSGEKSQYDLTFPGDLQSATHTELLESKRPQFQAIPNYYDCGLYCLFAAAIRAGLKEDELFMFAQYGIPQISNDTKITHPEKPELGIKIRKRSELIQ